MSYGNFIFKAAGTTNIHFMAMSTLERIEQRPFCCIFHRWEKPIFDENSDWKSDLEIHSIRVRFIFNCIHVSKSLQKSNILIGHYDESKKLIKNNNTAKIICQDQYAKINGCENK